MSFQRKSTQLILVILTQGCQSIKIFNQINRMIAS